jgi:hypothetical protein
MMHTEEKYLEFHCGRFGMLLSVSSIMEITEFHHAWCEDSGSSAQHHGKLVLWRDHELLFLDMRVCLGTEALQKPLHALILRDPGSGEAVVLIAVDDIQQIVDIPDNQWHWFSGIDPQLDCFFDRIYPVHQQLLMRLAPTTDWLKHHAY